MNITSDIIIQENMYVKCRPVSLGCKRHPVANSNLISLQPPLYHIEKMILYSHEYKQELSYFVKNILAEAGAALSPALGAAL